LYDYKIYFQGLVALYIDFTESLIEVEKNKLYNIPQEIKPINYIAVYTDLIDDQYLGNTQAPILLVVPVETTSDNSVLSSFYNNLHYVPVRTNTINTINITLKDLSDQLIKFSDLFSFVVCKLHFRPIQ